MNTSITSTKSSARERFAHPGAVGDRVGRVAGLDDHRPEAVGWSVRISSGITLHGTSPPKIRSPATGLRGARCGSSSLEKAFTSGTMVDGIVLAAVVGEVAGQRPDELLEVADERRVAVHLDAEVLERGDARCGRDATGRPADEILVDAGDLAELGDVERGEPRVDLVETRGVLAQPGVGAETLLHDDRHHRRQQPCVTAGCDLEVEVGDLRRLGDPRVDHHDRPARRRWRSP